MSEELLRRPPGSIDEAELADRAAIEDVLAAYCDGVDTADIEAIADLFTDDAVYDYGFGRTYTGREQIARFLVEKIGLYAATSHHASNARIWIDGDTARVRSYVLAWHRRPDRSTATIWGRYLDDFVRTPDGIWKIAVRRGRAGATEGFVTPAGLPSSHELIGRADVIAGAPDDHRPEHPLFEVMRTARATRSFTSEPVPSDLLRKVLTAATWAPSPQNRQPWELVLVTESAVKAQIAAALAQRSGELEAMAAEMDDPKRARLFRKAAGVLTSLGSTPAIVLICGRPLGYESPAGSDLVLGSALHAAAQNLMLAARAVGLGAVYTTFHAHNEPAIRAALSIPDDVVISSLIPIGWPATPFGPVRRRPLDEVLHENGW